MGFTSDCSRYSIGIVIGVTTSEVVQDTLDGGSSANDIFVEKSDGEGGRLDVYSYCWGALWGIR